MARLGAAGLLARQVSQSDARLVVSPISPGTALDAAAIETLAAARGEIVDLDLADTTLDDARLQAIGALPKATHLRLARNRLTDEGLRTLAGSPQLKHLNLYGNAGITDLAVEALAGITSLRELFLWQTGVTAAGADRLRALRPDLIVENGMRTNKPDWPGRR